MESEWNEGDLALCIKQSMWRDRATSAFVSYGPRAGSIFTVTHVGASDIPGRGMTTTLSFPEWGRDQFAAYHFVKLRPGQTPGELREARSELIDAEGQEVACTS